MDSVKLPAIARRIRESGVSPEEFVRALSAEELEVIAHDRDLWRPSYQDMPKGDWRRWSFRAGRFAGKTHTGSSTTNDVAEDRKKVRTGTIGLIGGTYADVRFTMIEGPGGILDTARPDFMPEWHPGTGTLKWPNGVMGRAFSADKPERIRGVNWSWVWGDEPAHWPNLYETWMSVIEPGLRRGWQRAMLTTTPIRNRDLMKIEELPDGLSVVTTASSLDNPYIAQKTKDSLVENLKGTRWYGQELLGEYALDNEHALWTRANLEQHRVSDAPDMVRIVVAIDPAVTNEESSDETGLVVVGRGADGRGYVLDDKSMKGSPLEWARMAVALYHRWQASRIVAEVNNGGDMVETTLRVVDKNVPYTAVRASRGKATRAEPVAALYERGKVSHVGVHEELEEQQVSWDPTSDKSPDRVDALVWALHELFFDKNHVGPLSAYLNLGKP